jgi:hypothetical protein
MIEYSINNSKFRDYGVIVNSSRGLTAGLTPKERTKHDWKDRHGEEVVLSTVYYEARDIRLECTLTAPTMDVFMQRVADFTKLFLTPFKKRLKVGVSANALVYDVYLAEKIDIDKRWRDGQCYGKFTLSLREPEPIKQVLKFTRTASVTTVSITLNSSAKLNISWGDSTFLNNVSGTQTFTHYYATEGTFYIIVSGCFDDKITATTAQKIWTNLY